MYPWRENMTSTEKLFFLAWNENCTLSTARAALGLTQVELRDAVKYRIAVCDKGKDYIVDYRESIEEGMRRLWAAN